MSLAEATTLCCLPHSSWALPPLLLRHLLCASFLLASFPLLILNAAFPLSYRLLIIISASSYICPSSPPWESFVSSQPGLLSKRARLEHDKHRESWHSVCVKLYSPANLSSQLLHADQDSSSVVELYIWILHRNALGCIIRSRRWRYQRRLRKQGLGSDRS